MKEIKDIAKQLKLPYIRNNIEDEIKEAIHLNKDYSQFIKQILERELQYRKENVYKHRLKAAKFPYKKYLEDLDRKELPSNASQKLKELETLDFIRNGQNVILLGNPGVGKTHIAIGLGIRACLNNMSVLYITVPNLITELKESVSLNQLSNYKKKFIKDDLVILDELGYISFDKKGSEILFNLLSHRSETKSKIVTSNLSYERWDEVFSDPILTAAMVDRLTHKSYIINMHGESYRLKETKQWLSNN